MILGVKILTYREMREAAGMSVRALAEQMKTQFPRISPPGISFAENPGESGLTYTREAAAALRIITGTEKTRRPDRRKCPVRIQARLNDAEARELKTARVIMGHITINEALRYALRLYIRAAKKRAAGAAGTATDGKQMYTNAII